MREACDDVFAFDARVQKRAWGSVLRKNAGQGGTRVDAFPRLPVGLYGRKSCAVFGRVKVVELVSFERVSFGAKKGVFLRLKRNIAESDCVVFVFEGT